MERSPATFQFRCEVCGELNLLDFEDDKIRTSWVLNYPCSVCGESQPSMTVRKRKIKAVAEGLCSSWGLAPA